MRGTSGLSGRLARKLSRDAQPAKRLWRQDLLSGIERLLDPGATKAEVAANGRGRDCKNFGNALARHAGKEGEVHHLGAARIELFKLLKRLVQRQ